MLSQIPPKREYDVLKYQLSKSSTSIGANYEESQNTTSNEFSQRIRISVREALETRYWLKLISALNLCNVELRIFLQKEIDEIIKILRAILKKTNQHHNV
ncbi:MAG: four helix bundle protein [Ignavibacteriales bacterium]|nr:four helix bundle protein [Ignavibacteriales bacterium]